jgi:hypothetical protein
MNGLDTAGIGSIMTIAEFCMETRIDNINIFEVSAATAVFRLSEQRQAPMYTEVSRSVFSSAGHAATTHVYTLCSFFQMQQRSSMQRTAGHAVSARSSGIRLHTQYVCKLLVSHIIL